MTDPHELFETWFAEARAAEPNDAEAMTLATATPDGAPSARMVLLKGHDARGFVFYTNSQSRKGEELAANPSLVKSKNVRPPSGTGRIRLVCIGEAGAVDSQPCGGTHVRSTGEVGEIHIGKIEKKGRENRRFRIRFGPLPPA